MEKNDLRTELNPFEMLEELLWQDQFELIFPENEKQSELRLVYLMNDAVESFLVFVNAKMTGQYQPDYEGELEAELSREDTEDGCIYVLIVHQGDSVVTIFFEKLNVYSAFRLLDVDTQTGRGICLRVCVHNEHFLFQGGKGGCEVNRSRCFSYTTFLICQSNNFSHNLSVYWQRNK